MKSFKNYLRETPLSPKELNGVHGQTKELRLDILVKLIKGNKPLKMVKGKGYPDDLFLVTDKELALKSIEQFKRDEKSFAIGVYNDKPVMSNHILKSKPFGGESAGSSAGTKATADSESAQCLWCAALVGEGHTNPIEHFTDDVLSKYKNKIDIGKTTLKEVLAIPDSWKKSAYLSASLLASKGYINKNQTFHRDSKIMNGIYNAKKKAFKNNDMPNLNNDKWNPGDIWAVNESIFKLEKLNTDTVLGLNADLLEHYNERSCVGISLKKVVKKASFKEYNLKLPPITADHKITKYQIYNPKTGFWNAMDGSVFYDEGRINTKRNKDMGSNKIEIAGKNSRGGSMGWGPIMDAAELVFGKQILPDTKAIEKRARSIIPKKKGAKTNKKEVKAFYDLIMSLDKNVLGSFKDYEAELLKKSTGWVMAKLASLLFIKLIHDNNGNKANRFVTKCINYAASKAEDSSVFIKIQ